MPVMVANPVLKTVALTETYTGRFTPVEEVDLQARVSGYLESVHFTEGQQIEKGDLMFRIVPHCSAFIRVCSMPRYPVRKQARSRRLPVLASPKAILPHPKNW